MMSLPYRALLLLLGTMLLYGCGGPKKDPVKVDKRAELHYQVGIDALHKNQLPKAFDELMKSDELRPGHPEVLGALAYAWRLRKNYEQSERYYKKALNAGGGASTHTNYGSLLLLMERYKEAEVQLRKALQDPRYRNQHIAFINLGDALLAQDRFDEAVDAYRQAKIINPRQDASRLKEAEAYVKYNRLNYAQALYETLLREYPTDRNVLQGLLGVLKKRGDIPSQRQHLKTFREASQSELDRAWAADELERLVQQ